MISKKFNCIALSKPLIGGDMGLNTPPKSVWHHSQEGVGAENTDLPSQYSDSYPIIPICLKLISGVHVIIWAHQAYKGRGKINIVLIK